MTGSARVRLVIRAEAKMAAVFVVGESWVASLLPETSTYRVSSLASITNSGGDMCSGR